MKDGIHPDNYRTCIFLDTASGSKWLSKSCARSANTAAWEDGNEYPVITLGISNLSHPFYTGQQKFVDTAGRVDKFQQRAAKTAEAQAKLAERKVKKRR
jgi:large subunit ribosomal protein L31